MKYSFCYIAIGILLSLQGYSHTLRNMPDSTFLLNYYPNDTTGIYFYNSYLDEKQYFPNGKQSLINWFRTNINYPSELLLVHNLKMNCYLSVVADTFGRISLEKIAYSIPKHKITGETYPILRDSIARKLNSEILKSINTFPVCEPGKHRGAKRAIHFVLTYMLNPSVNQQKAASLKPLDIPVFPMEK